MCEKVECVMFCSCVASLLVCCYCAAAAREDKGNLARLGSQSNPFPSI